MKNPLHSWIPRPDSGGLAVVLALLLASVSTAAPALDRVANLRVFIGDGMGLEHRPPADCLAKRLSTFRGQLQSDGYAARRLLPQARAATSARRWERLQGYTRHGHVEIDNHLVENAIQSTAVGKKNGLFFGIHPPEYLLDVLPRLSTMTHQTAPLHTPAQGLANQTVSTGLARTLTKQAFPSVFREFRCEHRLFPFAAFARKTFGRSPCRA